MIPGYFIYVGIVLQVAGEISYLRNIVQGQVKPNIVSWVIWALAPIIGVFFQFKAGVGLSVLPLILTGLISLFVIGLSLSVKNAYWKIRTFDLVCGAVSVASLILYIFTHNLDISILFAIIADSLAYLPTIKKAWSNPDTETGLMYMTGGISNVFGLLVITNWIFPIYSFYVSIIFFNSVLLFVIYRRKIFSSSFY